MNATPSGPRDLRREGRAGYFSEEDIAPTRALLHDAPHLPGRYYTSPDIYEMEIEKLFMRDWLMVARVEEFSRPGDFMTMEVVGEPILLCMDEDRALRAFANVCRHRGAAVASGNGNTPAFAQKVQLLKDFARRFAAEDMELLQHTQKGLRSRRFASLPLLEVEKRLCLVSQAKP